MNSIVIRLLSAEQKVGTCLLMFKECLFTMVLCKSPAGDRIKEIPYAPHCVLAACAREIFTRAVNKKDTDAI